MARYPTILAAILMCSSGAAWAESRDRVEPLAQCFAAPPEGVVLGSGIDCGYVTVPQDRTDDSRGTIQLAFMRIHAVEDKAEPPLFIVAGGPGQSAATDERLVLFNDQLIGPITARHDVILLEQRGTFHSRPALLCPDRTALRIELLEGRLDPAELDGRARAVLQTCIARLQTQGVDFASYNTAESASDINDVRTALGYDRIVLYGESYGTLLAQFVLRQHPDALAGLILDGTEAPATRSWAAERAINTQWGLDNLAKLCADQPECVATFDIPAMIENLFATFGDEPIAVSVANPDGQEPARSYSFKVGPEDLAAYVYSLQTSKFGTMVLPLEVTQMIASGRDAIAGKLARNALAGALASGPESDKGMLSLMHAAMVCSDDPVVQGEAIDRQGAGAYARHFAASVERQYANLCTTVSVPQLSDSSDAMVKSDVPTLILSGGLDVQTPYFRANAVAENLTAVTHVVFPAGYHVQIANLNRCAMTIMNAFVDQPGAVLDTACANEERPLPFVTAAPADTTAQ